MTEPSLEDIMDGLALWEEHKPHSSQDWIAVAERCLDDPTYDRSRSGPLFRALVECVEKLRGQPVKATT